MSDFLNKNFTLVLNNAWNVIGFTSIRKAIVAMCSTQNGDNMSATAIDLDFELDGNGFVDFSKPTKMVPVGMPEWSELSIRDYDLPIRTSHKIIRSPIILIAKNFSKMTYRKMRPTKKNIYNFYQGRCIWTGKVLSLNESSVEHMICRSHNGDSSWQNLGLSNKKLNSERGNLKLEEWKYKQQYELKEPKSTPVSALITTPARPEWIPFLIKK